MTKEEFDRISRISDHNFPLTIRASDFTKDRTERTLLYGYDVNRNLHHVYLIEGFVRRWDRANDQETYKQIDEFESYAQLVPNKRLYPHLCDYDFCVYLRTKLVYLPFTKYPDTGKVKKKQFYGDII